VKERPLKIVNGKLTAKPGTIVLIDWRHSTGMTSLGKVVVIALAVIGWCVFMYFILGNLA
jgi:hypothetical protein